MNIGKDFSPNLTHRDRYQRDGKCSGVEFRDKYLAGLNNPCAWEGHEPFITLYFIDVKRLSPAWANEVFAHFGEWRSAEDIRRKIKVIGASKVIQETIDQEIESGCTI